MPPATTQTPSQVAEINRIQIRLSVARNKRNPLTNTLNHLRTEYARKNAELANMRNQVRQAAQEAQYARNNHLEEERRLQEGIIVDLDWRMARSTREWEELGMKIENVNKALRELDREVSGLVSMLNPQTSQN